MRQLKLMALGLVLGGALTFTLTLMSSAGKVKPLALAVPGQDGTRLIIAPGQRYTRAEGRAAPGTLTLRDRTATCAAGLRVQVAGDELAAAAPDGAQLRRAARLVIMRDGRARTLAARSVERRVRGAGALAPLTVTVTSAELAPVELSAWADGAGPCQRRALREAERTILKIVAPR